MNRSGKGAGCTLVAFIPLLVMMLWMCSLGVVMLSTKAMGLGLFFLVGALFGTLVGAGVFGWIAYAFWTANLVAGPGYCGARTGGYSSTYPIETLRLDGMPGRAVTFKSRRGTWLSLTPDVEGPWTPASLAWFIETLGRVTGAEIVDDRDVADWHRWETDPLYRGLCSVDGFLETNRREFPHYHQANPVPPGTVETHDAVRLKTKVRRAGYLLESATITIDAHHISVGENFQIALADVLRVYVYFKREGKRRNGVLAVWTERGEFILGVKQLGLFASAGVMNGIPPVIERYLPSARELEGTAADVPEALRQARAKAQT